jgi:hypothetical protein
MIRYLLVSLLIVCVTEAAVGQDASDSINNEYIERYQDKFFIWPLVKKRSLSFDVRKGDGDKVNYKPNNSYSLGLGVYLFEISAEISFELPMNEKS